jgi:O-succinylbenzoate synthase
MKIEQIILHDFSLPLTRPFMVKDTAVAVREGIVVEIITDKGVIGLGEASPLPGLSIEPLKKSKHQLKVLAEEWKGRSFPLEAKELVRWLARAFASDFVCPSTRFALESAVLMAVASAKGCAVCELLKPGSRKVVHSAGLLQGSLADVVDQARALKVKGLTTFKLKVGNRNIPLDVQKVEEVKAVLGPHARMRLDANRAWRFDEALLFFQNIGKNQIEFIEEPTAELDKWENIFRRTDIPLAVDESLVDWPYEDLAATHGLGFFVVKPTVWGGVTGTLDLLSRAQQSGQKVVLSSSFESGVGQAMLANLAALSDEVAGFGPADWFAEDLLTLPLMAPSGLIPPVRLSLSPDDLSQEWRHRWGMV